MKNIDLEEMIAFLEKLPGEKMARFGLHYPHSYRGYYDCLEFTPCVKPMSAREILGIVRPCLGETFTGWKGGDFKMGGHTDVYIGKDGSCQGQQVGELFLRMMFDLPLGLEAEDEG